VEENLTGHGCRVTEATLREPFTDGPKVKGATAARFQIPAY
jgi:hypothetical protein